MENGTNSVVLLRKSQYEKMCKIQRDIYKTCVVPDDFNLYENIPLTLLMACEYQFWQSVEKNIIASIMKLPGIEYGKDKKI